MIRALRLVPRELSIGLLVLVVAVGACDDGHAPDAYGTFEATEVVVSAEASGPLLWFTPEEGLRLTAGALVGVIDTTELALERRQILAQRAAARSRVAQVALEIQALEVQHRIARRAYERTQRLYAQQAATTEQLDRAEREVRVLSEQVRATEAQRRGASQEVAAADARLAQVQQRIRKSRIATPLGGTVLASYVRAHELVRAGQPLFKLADLDSMDLRAYVTGAQLAAVRLGQPAEVTIDVGRAERRSLPGRVSWIAAEAEFTPTPIQTRDERTGLVYAIKVRVANPDGLVKIGMPADVRFLPAVPAEREGS
jgi:HlyD family secretion protein